MAKKILVVLGSVLGLSVVALGVALATIDPQKIVSARKDDLLKVVSDKVGRQVSAGEVTAAVGASITARVVDLQLAGTEGRPPQLVVGSIDMRFSLLRALVSLGRDLHVEEFTVRGLVLRAARDEEGRWDFEDILDRASSEPDPDEAAAPPTQTKDALAGLRIAGIHILEGTVELDDKLLGRPLAIRALDIQTSDVVPEEPLTVALRATLEDGPRKSPVELDARLAVLPPDLSFAPLPGLEVKTRLTDVDLGPWGGLLPGDVPAPVQGTLRAQLNLSAQDDAQRIHVDGSVLTRGLVLRDGVGARADAAARARAPRGLPLDMDVELALDADTKMPRYEVTKLNVRGSGLELSGTALAQGTSLAQLERASMQLGVADLGKLLAVLPPSLRALPPALVVDGPLAARLSATGAEVEASLDLDRARVRWLDLDEGEAGEQAAAALFDKAASRPLNLTLHAARTGDVLDVDRFALALDTARIQGTLSLPTAAGAPVSADIRSGPVELTSLQGLLPPFREALGRGQRVAGVLDLTVKAQAASGKQLADAAVTLRDLDVNLSSTTVKGSASLTLKAAPAGDGVDVSTTADFDGLSVVQRGSDGATVMSKPTGMPLRLEVNARKGKDRADVSNVKLAIGKSTVSGKGTVTDLDKDAPRLAVDLGNVLIGFDDLRAALPGASKLPAGGRLGGAVQLSGGTATHSIAVDVQRLDMGFGSSRITGDVNVKNMEDPVLDVNLSSVDIAFDDVRGLATSAESLPRGGRFKGAVQLRGDTKKSASVKARVKVDAFSAPGTTMRGTMQVENLDKPRFELDLQADSLDVDKLLGAEEPTSAPKAPRAPRENPHGLSKSARDLLANVNGRGTITAQRAIVEGIPVQAFKGTLVMTRGVARFDPLEFTLYGGRVKATGTSLDLPPERTGYDLRLDAKDIDLGAALAAHTRLGKIFSATVSPDIRVKGRGIAPGDFALTAEGPAELSFKSFSIKTLDLLGPLGDALKKSGKIPGLKLSPVATQGLDLDGFTALTQFMGGRIKLAREVETPSKLGKIAWQGTAGLDAGLDLSAVVHLTPAVMSTMSGGKLKLKEPVPVPMRIQGTWDKPRISGVDVGRLITAILASAGGEAVKEKAQDVAKDVLGSVLGGGDDAGSKGNKKDGKTDSKEGGKNRDKKKSTADKAMDAAKGLLGR